MKDLERYPWKDHQNPNKIYLQLKALMKNERNTRTEKKILETHIPNSPLNPWKK
jgi:hypothetical protein